MRPHAAAASALLLGTGLLAVMASGVEAMLLDPAVTPVDKFVTPLPIPGTMPKVGSHASRRNKCARANFLPLAHACTVAIP